MYAGENKYVGITVLNCDPKYDWQKDWNDALLIWGGFTYPYNYAQIEPASLHVEPGQNYQFVTLLLAPDQPGTYYVYAQMDDEFGINDNIPIRPNKPFGELLVKAVSVVPRPNSVENWELYD